MSLDYTRPSSSSKRKLDDYGLTDDDSNLVLSVRMRKDDELIEAVNSFPPNHIPPPHHHHHHHHQSSSSEWNPSSSSSSSSSSLSHAHQITPPPPMHIQFFVKMMPYSSPTTTTHKTLVLRANPDDTIASVHDTIRQITGIPTDHQRLIHAGKQLPLEHTLAECSVQNNAGLTLLARMRSTPYPNAWRLVDDLIALALALCRGPEVNDRITVSSFSSKVKEFLDEINSDNNININKLVGEAPTAGHLQVFTISCAPLALVMLYMSPYKGNKERGDESIRRFVSWCLEPKCSRFLCVPIVLGFCKLLGRGGVGGGSNSDPLYCFCRSSLVSMMDCVRVVIGTANKRSVCGDSSKALVPFRDVYMFVLELMERLCFDFGAGMGPSPGVVGDLTAFLVPMCTAIMEHPSSMGLVSLPMRDGDYESSCYGKEMKALRIAFDALAGSLDRCLEFLEEWLAAEEKGEVEHLPLITRFPLGCAQYLAILKDMDNLSRLYFGAQDKLGMILKRRKVAVCHLVIKYASRSDDQSWLLKHKGAMDFESRRHFAVMMLPEVKEDYEEIHEMLIDRSQILAESFEYFSHAGPETLRAGLFMEFKNEEATGPGVLREWFCLVCQAIFNPQNALFLACPNDRRRFFPNPASKVDPLHLKYFKFSGRVIALALMHKVQVGIVFDRVFFLQLAGKNVSLEDIHDADPCLYSSCKKVLEMDAEMVDSDALGLTFVLDVEELGSRRIVELCPGGKNIVVNSRNREVYVKYLIEHRFVTSITEQVAWFAQGFSDILCDWKLQKCFFQSLELEDLDWMLHGSENAISVEDWKAHTEYRGYKETDPQILWFWKIVGQMSADQRKVLLFFWTSVKYLPVEGFRGLGSRLFIHKSSESYNRLPSSHTCFYQLCFAPYPSMAVMEDRLRIITQEHVGSSFGTW